MSAKPRCVIVDDDPDFLIFAGSFTVRIRPDFEVTEFPGGLAALEFLAKNQVDLVITDYRMPGMNGLQLASAVRWIYPAMPIVLMSGDDLEKEAVKQGISAFVAKRSFTADLTSAIQRLRIPARI
ncbi:MAG: response regulator [Opitutaceae bacterium]